ncbi:hypothetical protein PHIM7_300 [Sinorhizobium phage phiM7]|uniref:Uncharacterized protein n=2 Tax=Emdodecavirus TaxID=1980937 RepID=S5MDH0_9CAUD|nr:hypothetical protein AB690_gp211 [Sinorhizobium phage phiM12]YP_009601425.1 hypothetical protein FDH46_gp178 [Sinorhizobium phage phiM7]AGR48019.1 hypothetical protein SmphiM12_387 [Sinorhizobium phage phiM12]AKF12846.1 hypothetical protein PHIM7_300 [Sinorhizobium phage phiM7]AKF13205.1 hypothetical protein PHIM19_300 [Sinorhizobium phage phiM19]
MGLTVNVYKSGTYDCTLNGISSRTDRICVVNMSGPFEPDESTPAAILVVNPVGNPVIKPAIQRESDGEWVVAPGWWMNGGNLAASSDSRFGEAVRKLNPGFYGGLYIHDRQE